MSYLERLRQGEFSQKRLPDRLTKPSKGALVAFDGFRSEQPSENSGGGTYVWDAVVGGKRLTIIDPERLSIAEMESVVAAKFGSERVDHVRRK